MTALVALIITNARDSYQRSTVVPFKRTQLALHQGRKELDVTVDIAHSDPFHVSNTRSDGTETCEVDGAILVKFVTIGSVLEGDQGIGGCSHKANCPASKPRLVKFGEGGSLRHQTSNACGISENLVWEKDKVFTRL